MTRESLQGFFWLVGLTQGLLPLGLKLFGAGSGPIWCVPARLDGSIGWVAAIGALAASVVTVILIEERA